MRGENPAIQKNIDGPKILKSEVTAAIRQMRGNISAGPDNIVTEMITVLEELGIEKITEISYQIYDSGEIPEDLCKSVS